MTAPETVEAWDSPEARRAAVQERERLEAVESALWAVRELLRAYPHLKEPRALPFDLADGAEGLMGVDFIHGMARMARIAALSFERRHVRKLLGLPPLDTPHPVQRDSAPPAGNGAVADPGTPVP